MIALITTTPSHDTTELKKFVTHVREAIEDLEVPGDEFVGFLGSQTILVDSVEESSTTVTKIDLIVLPLALCVLMYVVQSWRMVIIPIINVATCLLSSFAMMYGITMFTVKAPSFVPSVMEAMVIALSIDYSLFLLTRYRFEVLTNNRRGSYAVREAVYHAGEVVFMSGLTLISCFLGMTGFPTDTVYMVGVGCSLCLTMALIINLTMTPALLLAFPTFFSTFQFLPFCMKKEGPGSESADALAAARAVEQGDYQLASDSFEDDHVNGGLDSYSPPRRIRQKNSGIQQTEDGEEPAINGVYHGQQHSSDVDFKSSRDRSVGDSSSAVGGELGFHNQSVKNEAMKKSYWYRSTKFLIQWPWVIFTILIPLALIAPAAFQLLKFRYSVANTQIAPRNSPSMECYRRVERNFPLGLMDPLYVIVDGSRYGGGAVKNAEFFNTSALIAQMISERTQVSPMGVTAVSYLNGTSIDWNTAQILLANPGPTNPYPAFFNTSTNSNMDAALITITTPFAPFGDDMKPFTSSIRNILKDPKLSPKYSYYFAGAAVWMVDATTTTFELFPYIILATVLAIFLMISFLLRSAFIPIRYTFTLVFPLSFIFGLAVMIYQDGVLNGLSWDAIRGTDGMYWLAPIITFPICTGLALDYDIFLMCRVAEYRMEGYTNRASILKAVHETGGIITAAGIIMAIAFGGMLFSTTDTLNQIAWILFSSVLFDTFVVRTILVPAVLTIAAAVNWWPRKVPTSGLKDEFEKPAQGGEHHGDGDSKDQALLSVNGSENGGWVHDDGEEL
eukprot:CAMPEP_0184504814 /NCGR_PEP_ID=MMETSP0113_2-20130426/52661_1 /TAXON_ID=91329 /ORGANISM="Norrisiella sphaerica, Strain BC52" /LENGTH=786 /DNA_ID=CAMNT_0026894473 /DNA_START=654 /DNA_END=3014 /DNA_ORIENTATION=+